MTTKIQSNQGSELKKLRAEVDVLRSFIIGVAGRDPEGHYRPEFVRQVLGDSQAQPSAYFNTPEKFLELVGKTEE
jgi:hypothetical protein